MYVYEMGGGSVMMQAGGSGRQPRGHRDVGAVVMARLVNALRSDCTLSYISTPETLFPVSQTVRAEPC